MLPFLSRGGALMPPLVCWLLDALLSSLIYAPLNGNKLSLISSCIATATATAFYSNVASLSVGLMQDNLQIR